MLSIMGPTFVHTTLAEAVVHRLTGHLHLQPQLSPHLRPLPCDSSNAELVGCPALQSWFFRPRCSIQGRTREMVDPVSTRARQTMPSRLQSTESPWARPSPILGWGTWSQGAGAWKWHATVPWFSASDCPAALRGYLPSKASMTWTLFSITNQALKLVASWTCVR